MEKSTPIEEFNDDQEFQKKEVLFERFGWITMTIAAIASLLGLFGKGPLSEKTLRQGEATLQFELFQRNHDETTFYLSLDSSPSELVRISVSNRYLFDNKLKMITPLPRMIAGSEETLFEFKVVPNQGPYRFRFDFETESMGPVRGRLKIIAAETIEFNFNQFVFP